MMVSDEKRTVNIGVPSVQACLPHLHSNHLYDLVCEWEGTCRVESIRYVSPAMKHRQVQASAVGLLLQFCPRLALEPFARCAPPMAGRSTGHRGHGASAISGPLV